MNNIETVWERNEPEIVALLQKEIMDENDADDLKQEIFLKLHRQYMIDGQLTNPGGWLYRVTKNAIADYYRHGKKLVSFEELRDEPLVDSSPDVLQRAAMYVEPLIGRLPREYAEPLRLDTIDDLKQETIAQRLNIAPGTLRTRLSRARKMLKSKILECAHLETDSAGKISNFSIRHECDFLTNQVTK
jgi:RNA polymerase sigma-70 factor, ECF subfamily